MNCKRCLGTGTEPDESAIGNSLRKLREDAGITLRGMAELLGLSHSYLSQLENGARHWRRSIQIRYQQAIQRNQKHQTK